jgi:hypothetical protein
MGIENISTGYKPEFSLGALYHGFNAGSQDNASQLANLIQEQALQKSRVEDPYEVLKTQYEGLLANAKSNSPSYIPWMMQGTEGQMKSQDAAGQLAQSLLPFKQRAEEAALNAEGSKNRLFGNMYQGIEQQHDQSLDPNVREAAGQRGFFLADTMSRVDPATMAKERMLEGKLDNNIDLAEIRARAAQQSHQTQQKDPKYKEQLAAMFRVMANPNATPQEKYEAQMFITLDQKSKLLASGAAWKPQADMSQFGIQTNPAPAQQLQLPTPPTPQGNTAAPVAPQLPAGWSVKK